jgi:hypothetical protein
MTQLFCKISINAKTHKVVSAQSRKESIPSRPGSR